MKKFQVMPPLSDKERKALKEDIKENGVLVPIVYDEEGNILDGFHRTEICEELGIEDWPSITKTGLNESEKKSLARKLNIARRQLSQEDKRELIKDQLKDTPKHSNNRIAEMLGVGDPTVAKYRKELENGSKIKNHEKLEGKDGVKQPKSKTVINPSNKDRQATEELTQKAEKEEDEKAETQLEKISKGKSTPSEANKEYKNERRKQQRKEAKKPETSTPDLPDSKYRTLVIDPPWNVEKIGREVRPDQGKYLDYPVMNIEEIKDLPIENLLHKSGGHIYLWTTHKYLPKAMEILESWNARYECLLTWVKPTGVAPFSWQYNTEHVLFARYGSGLNLEKNGLQLSFEAPVTKHSEKPDIFYQKVKKASPEPRLEMFARKTRKGFDTWGDEVG